MKKLLLVMSIAVAAGLTGCTNDTTTDSITPKGTHTINASIVVDQTRTQLGDKGESTTPILWSSQDKILAIDRDKSTSYVYILNDGSAGKKSGSFTSESGNGVSEATNIIAFYPCDNVSYGTTTTMSIAATQRYIPGRSFDTNLNPMYAVSSNPNDLQFKHLAGVINLQLTSLGEADNNRKVTKIELTSAEHTISGIFNVTNNSDDKFILEATENQSESSKKTTINCDQVGVALSSEAKSFIFVVPAGSYASRDLSFTIYVTDAQGVSGSKTLTMTNPLTIAQGEIVNFKATAVPNVVVVQTSAADAASNISEAINNIDTSQSSAIHVVIDTSLDESTSTVEIPASFNTTEKQAIPVTIEIPESTATSITIKTADQTAAPKQVTINNTSSAIGDNAPSFIIEMPTSSVNINGSFNAIDATTADNTLIIEKGAVVKTLTVKKGSVKIYGVVDNIAKEVGAGSVSRYISTSEGLAQAVVADDKADNIYFDSSDHAIDGAGATLTKAAKIIGNTKLANLTMNSVKGNNLTIDADNIDVLLTNVIIYQTENNSNAGLNCAILAANHNNVSLTVKDSHLIVPKSNQRGINVHSATKDASVCTITLDNTHIGPKLEIMGAGDYSAEQNAIFKGLFDTRGISVGAHKGKTILNIINGSQIEGVFYVINSIQHNDDIEVNVRDSRLDGRAAFNIWSDSNIGAFNIFNSKLIGRNPFGGPTEEFATIVLCENSGTWPGSGRNIFNITDSEIYCYNNPETDTNTQYAVDMRSPKKNTLNLLGTTKIYDKSTSMRLQHAIDVDCWINDINIAPTVTMYGNPNATILPTNIWDGASYSFPAVASDGKIYIGDPAELAQITLSEKSKLNMVITRDLDMGGHTWQAKKLSSSTIDGAGHTIHNLNATGSVMSGLLSDAVSCTIKNLTLENATVKASDINGAQNAYAGGFIGRCYGAITLENCTLKNSTIEGINKVGGLIGFNAENSVVIKDCTVQGSTIRTSDTELEHGQCGGVLGYVGNLYKGTTIITGTRVIDTKVEAAPNEAQSYRHNSIYVGSFQGTADDKLTIIAPPNAIQNSTLNGVAPDTSKYNGLLGGVRFTATLSTSTILTINNTRYTE